MSKRPKSDRSSIWYCVHDFQMRQLYLGTDEAEAKKLEGDGTVLRSGATPGEAMRLAAQAYAVERPRRFGKQ